jgi:hypothetical protein
MNEQPGFNRSQHMTMVYDAQQDKHLWLRVLNADDDLAHEGAVVLYAGGAKLVIGLAAWAEMVAAVAATQQPMVSAEMQSGMLREAARAANKAARDLGWS